MLFALSAIVAFCCNQYILAWDSVSLSKILNKNLISAHGVNDLGADGLTYNEDWASSHFYFNGSDDRSTHSPDSKPVLFCASISSASFYRETLSLVSMIPTEEFKVAFIRKSMDVVCFFTSQGIAQSVESHLKIPEVLKIDPSVLAYFRDHYKAPKHSQQRAEESALLPDDAGVKSGSGFAQGSRRTRGKAFFNKDELKLVLEFSPMALSKTSTRKLPLGFLSPAPSPSCPTVAALAPSPAWHRIRQLLGLLPGGVTGEDGSMAIPKHLRTGCSGCSLSQLPVTYTYTSRTVEIRNLQQVSDLCLAVLVERAALSASVLRIALGSDPFTMNFEARGVTQSGVVGHEPYHAQGLRGQGQVVGMSDTGVDDTSCFFRDNSNAYSAPRTDRNGVIEPLRRKIIQYVSWGDKTDYDGGHGSHVAGSLAGNSLSEYGNVDGMAPEAKIAVYDVGQGQRLVVPSLFNQIFPAAYAAGARVHSNSWGSNYHYPYTEYSYDVDRYTYRHPDFLVVLAAGNYGEYGYHTLVPPSDSKNCLSVGAVGMHDPLTDAHLKNSTIAWFSSQGPTSDGRIKPDIVAPGDFIMSAYSSPLELDVVGVGGHWGRARNLGDSDGGSSLKEQCATIAMSGTSMATPVAAGVAVLVRQYFMDPAFWAKVCNVEIFTCSRGAFTPSGYLIKTVILHSGADVMQYSLPNFDYRTAIDATVLDSPPDVVQGYGSLRLSNVLPLPNGMGLRPPMDLFVWDELNITEHSLMVWHVEVRKLRTSYIKATVSWYDPPAAFAFSSVFLLHDLDLLVVAPNGDKFWGNDIWGGDELNNNEQVLIRQPNCYSQYNSYDSSETKNCVYKIYVFAHFLPERVWQTFSLVITAAGSVKGPVYKSGHDILADVTSDRSTDAPDSQMRPLKPDSSLPGLWSSAESSNGQGQGQGQGTSRDITDVIDLDLVPDPDPDRVERTHMPAPVEQPKVPQEPELVRIFLKVLVTPLPSDQESVGNQLSLDTHSQVHYVFECFVTIFDGAGQLIHRVEASKDFTLSVGARLDQGLSSDQLTSNSLIPSRPDTFNPVTVNYTHPSGRFKTYVTWEATVESPGEGVETATAARNPGRRFAVELRLELGGSGKNERVAVETSLEELEHCARSGSPTSYLVDRTVSLSGISSSSVGLVPNQISPGDPPRFSHEDSQQDPSVSRTSESLLPKSVVGSFHQKAVNTTIAAVLSGNMYKEVPLLVNWGCVAVELTIALDFRTNSPWSNAADLIFTMQSPSSGHLVVMASPEQLHWPSDWYSGDNGSYWASFDITRFRMSGAGLWTLGFRNSYSISGDVFYIGIVRMRFSCDVSFESAPTEQPTFSPPTDSSLRKLVVQIPPTSLGVVRMGRTTLRQDRAKLKPFKSEGIIVSQHSNPCPHRHCREAAENGNYFDISDLSMQETDTSSGRSSPFIDGFNAAVFTVLITDPRGYSAQVGGHSWYGEESRFYMREWPDTWYSPFPAGYEFKAARDLSPAELFGDGEWTVEIASGYSSPITAREFAGNLTLYFAPSYLAGWTWTSRYHVLTTVVGKALNPVILVRTVPRSIYISFVNAGWVILTLTAAVLCALMWKNRISKHNYVKL